MAFWLSVVLAPVLFFIFYGMGGWTREKRALHDFASGCYVVRARELSAERQFGVLVGVLVFFLLVQIAMRATITVRTDDDTYQKSAPKRAHMPVTSPATLLLS